MCGVSCYGYGYGYILGPSPLPPIYLAGSFGPVLLPGWLDYIRSTAVPQIVELNLVAFAGARGTNQRG